MPLIASASPAYAEHIDVRTTENACPTNQLPDDPFEDVDEDNTFNDEITCIFEYEVTTGTSETEYSPENFVIRVQMAQFIARILRQSGETLDTSDAGFRDIGGLSQEARDSINGLANAGVVNGTTPTTFSPRNEVRRDQMASFIAQLQSEGLGRPVNGDENFFNDDNDNVHEENINIIADEGITIGRGGDFNYDPRSNVTRQQMAAFLARKLDILVSENRIENRFPGQPADVTVNETAVDAGDPITGEVTGTNVDSVTVSGDCVTSGGVADDDTTTDGVQFSIETDADATAGECELTFTVTFENSNRTQTFTRTVTINEAPQGTNERPELTSAAIVSTTTTGQVTPTNPAGTVVRFTFDEALLEETAGGSPNPALFHVITADGTRFDGDDIVDVEGNTVTVRFRDITTAEGASALTVATVDIDAVRDLEGDQNPEGDAPLGTSTPGGGTQPLAAGVTDAPDLTSVTGFRQAATAGQTAVDFTFDEAAFLAAGAVAADFVLVRTDGTELVGQQISTSTTTAGGQNVAGGNGTTTITVIFTSPSNTTTIDPATIARGVVEADTVQEAPATGETAALNPLQAVDVSAGGNTSEPDLVSVELRPGATEGAQDSALFTFDQTVTSTNAGGFFLFTTDGEEIQGTNARISSQDARQVLVDFATTDLVVGGNVREGAVTAGVSPTNLTADTNSRDEVGVANTTTAAPGQTAGRTDDPDLTGVALNRPTNEFGTPQNFQATYTFDEDVAGVQPGLFRLFLADGTQLNGSNCTVGGTEETDNTVVCTAFTVAGGTTGATSAQIGSAVLGTVDNGAVNDGATTGTPGTNPEGAEPTSGGTGTPTA